MTGNNDNHSIARVDSDNLKEIFNKIDIDKDGIIDVWDYKAALSADEEVFEWFELLNKEAWLEKRKKPIEEKKLMTVHTARKLRKKVNELIDFMDKSDSFMSPKVMFQSRSLTREISTNRSSLDIEGQASKDLIAGASLDNQVGMIGGAHSGGLLKPEMVRNN